jgi:hypothetical protein
MQNFSAVYEQTLAEFQSLIVPNDQADAAKGQVNTRAGLKINAMDRSIGFIRKNPGQTQHAGVGVDTLMSNVDGSWDDYLTDVAVNATSRRIKVAYTPHPAAGSPPYPDWVQPTAAHVAVPGPLQLKSDVGPGPDPTPEPPPSNDQYAEIIRKLDAQMQLILGMDAKMNALAVQSNNNTAAIQKQIHDLVEDVEETMKQVLPVIACRYSAGEGGAVSGLAGLLGGLLRRSKPPTNQP